MKKTLLFMNAIVFGTLTAFAQNKGQIRVKSGFTADIVAEAVPVEDNLVLGIDNGSVGLFSKTISFKNNGLPADMPLKAFETGNLYNIDYTKNNALRLLGPNDASGTSYESSGELILANPVKTDKLWLLCICGNGPTDLYVEVCYSDGDFSYSNITVEDWWNDSKDPNDHMGKDEAFWGYDRVDLNSGAPQGVTAVRILEKSIETNPEKEIKSVYIEKLDASKGYPTILGLSTGQQPVEVADGFNVDVIAEATPIDEYANASLDGNSWVLYSQALGELKQSTVYGLPDDGNIVTKSNRTYKVDYTTLNSTRLVADNAATPDVDESTTTLELEDKPTVSDYGSLVFLATAGNGPATIDITYNYEDGTHSTSYIDIPDWCNNQSLAAVQTGRYYGGVDDRDYVGLYEIEDFPESNKQIESITLNNYTSNNDKGFIMGIYLTDGTITTGIKDIKADAEKADGKMFNLNGQRVNESYKGIIIKNGKKHIVR